MQVEDIVSESADVVVASGVVPIVEVLTVDIDVVTVVNSVVSVVVGRLSTKSLRASITESMSLDSVVPGEPGLIV